MIGFLFGLLVFIVVIFAVIIVHELGHFIVAKLSGIRVDEFSFGFGWRIASRKKANHSVILPHTSKWQACEPHSEPPDPVSQDLRYLTVSCHQASQ